MNDAGVFSPTLIRFGPWDIQIHLSACGNIIFATVRVGFRKGISVMFRWCLSNRCSGKIFHSKPKLGKRKAEQCVALPYPCYSLQTSDPLACLVHLLRIIARQTNTIVIPIIIHLLFRLARLNQRCYYLRVKNAAVKLAELVHRYTDGGAYHLNSACCRFIIVFTCHNPTISLLFDRSPYALSFSRIDKMSLANHFLTRCKREV